MLARFHIPEGSLKSGLKPAAFWFFVRCTTRWWRYPTTKFCPNMWQT